MFGFDWGYVITAVVSAAAGIASGALGVYASVYQTKVQRRRESGQIETSEARDLWQARDSFDQQIMNALQFFSNDATSVVRELLRETRMTVDEVRALTNEIRSIHAQFSTREQ